METFAASLASMLNLSQCHGAITSRFVMASTDQGRLFFFKQTSFGANMTSPGNIILKFLVIINGFIRQLKPPIVAITFC